MKIIKSSLLLSISIFTILSIAKADVRLPAILGDHMVLQQKTKVKLWGWCDASENIKVSTSWDIITYNLTGTSEAKWNTVIQTPSSGGPYTITIKGNNIVTINDIMVGEVWACSGQSNMEMSYAWLQSWGLKLYSEVVEKSSNSNIRFFHVPRLTADFPQDDTKGRWVVSTPAEMKNFSLVAYFFGQKLQQNLKAPVGLINVSWGGTPAEVWTPSDSIKNKQVLNTAAKEVMKHPNKWWTVIPGAAYNAMIHPITNFNIAGALWYQGEANVSTATTYAPLLTTIINSWRTAWKKDFPFYYVQIAPFSGYGNSISSALLREQQTKVMQTANTGMIVIHDLVDDIKDIHPRNKLDVGYRLASYALGDNYGLKSFTGRSPSFTHFKSEKNRLRVYFNNADKGLISKNGLPNEFYISGADKIFKPAKAKIEGNSVILFNQDVKNPVAIRFGFTNSAIPNLFNKEGLPANIFRTDNWDTINTLP